MSEPKEARAVRVSVVIPAYNRVAPLLETLASADASCRRLGEPAEIIVIDDGSEPPLASVLTADQLGAFARVIRQPNQGSIIARLTGLREASGQYVLFLDSDDLIGEDKLLLHAQALAAGGAMACYDDVGTREPNGNGVVTRQVLDRVDRIAELLLRVQPPPHGCIFRRDYLLSALDSLIVPPLRFLDAVGDVWLYYNLSVADGPVAKIDLPLSLIGQHDEGRYSQHWERLGVASLMTAELFIRRCPRNDLTLQARRLVGEAAFNSWRRLPRDFPPQFSRRMLAVWRQAPPSDRRRLGGPLFRALAMVVGCRLAGSFLRLRNRPYVESRTIPQAELDRLLAQTLPEEHGLR